MDLLLREKDELPVAVAATVARRRLECGIRLNDPEAIAVITDAVLEGARDGRSVAELIVSAATDVPTRARWMGSAPDIIHEVQVEATFPDGTGLVTVHEPIR